MKTAALALALFLGGCATHIEYVSTKEECAAKGCKALTDQDLQYLLMMGVQMGVELAKPKPGVGL